MHIFVQKIKENQHYTLSEATKVGDLLCWDIVFRVLLPKKFCNFMDGGIMGGANVPSFCFWVLIQIYVRKANVIQVNEMTLLYDPIMCFISYNPRTSYDIK